jgi:hypothetical protein
LNFHSIKDSICTILSIIITKDFCIMSCHLIMKITIQYTQYFFTLNSNLFFKQAPTPIDSKIFVLYNYIKL